MKLLITFFSINSALRLNKLLLIEGISNQVITVPRVLSSSCGYSVTIEEGNYNNLIELMEDQSIEWETVYSQTELSGKESYEELATCIE